MAVLFGYRKFHVGGLIILNGMGVHFLRMTFACSERETID